MTSTEYQITTGETLDPTLSPYALESGLVGIKERVAYFRRSLDEVTRSVDRLPERLPAR